MKVLSREGLDFLKLVEGLSLKPYKDAADKWTIGYGHLMLPGEAHVPITLTKAERLLELDAASAVNAVNQSISISINQDQFDALVSFTYNVGEGAFRRSTLLKWINEGKPAAEIPKQLMRWIRAGGKPNLGLARRRVSEAAMYIG